MPSTPEVIRRALPACALIAEAIALVALPGQAQARTATDPCPPDSNPWDGEYPGLDPEGFTANGRVCTNQTSAVEAYHTAWIPLAMTYNVYPGNDLPAPPTFAFQCPPGTLIPGTGYWSTSFANNWTWDYYVEGGSWVLWDGQIPYVWPRDGNLPGGHPGYNSMVASLHNWYAGEGFIKTRVFWSCEPVSASRVPARPPESGGDHGDNTLIGDGHENALIGKAGDDRLLGRAGDDHLRAAPGPTRSSAAPTTT